MGKSKTRLLVHKDMQNVTINENVDIIITPQFYTFLKEELGVKFAYQAKQIAPSLFDDYLDRNKEYQFFVYKCEDYWCFFAYDIDEIVSFLETKGVQKYQIGKIFFTQELAPYLDKALDLGKRLALKSIDNITTIFPKRLLGENYQYQDLDLQKLSLNRGVSISSSFGSLIPIRETITISLLLTILGGIFILEGNRTKSSIGADLEKKELLLSNDPKLSSSRIRKSILAQYEPIDEVERLKRDTVADISKLLSVKANLKELTIDDKKISALIEADSVTIRQIIKQASKKNLKAKKEKKAVRVERVL
jgi:hypothetical protein